MTGVAAVIAADPTRVHASSVVDRMLDAMRHRGPARRSYGDSRRAIGCAETSESEVAGGMNGRWVAADARLANRRDLSTALEVEGLATDATLILQAYDRWGVDCAKRLEGDFAFVLWDGGEGVLYCARDAFGIRPLHYARVGGATRIASEAQALLADDAVSTRPDEETLATFVVDEYPSRGRTLYDGVSAFPPAHWARVGVDSFELTSFWTPDPFRRVEGSANSLAQELAEILRVAVAGRIDDTDAVGVLTSGGLDSTVVAAEAARVAREPRLLHVAFPGLDCDERAECELFAARMGLPLMTSNALESVSTGPASLGHRDLIYDPRWAAWQHALREARHRGTTRILTGEGGDLVLRPSGAETGDALARGAFRVAWNHAKSLQGRPTARLLREAGKQLSPAIVSRWRRRAQPGPSWVLTSRAREQVLARRHRRQRRFEETRFPDQTTRVLFEGLELNTWHCVNSMLDLIGATAGVELVHPWLDRRVVEWLLALPHEHRHAPSAHDKPKPILRKICLLYTSPSPRDRQKSRMPSSA